MSFCKQGCLEKPTPGRRHFFMPTKQIGDIPPLPTPDYQTIFTPETEKGLAISRKSLILHAPWDGLPSLLSGQAHRLINASFFARCHPLICFSRFAADNLSGCGSE
jgi:hypothetical protein